MCRTPREERAAARRYKAASLQAAGAARGRVLLAGEPDEREKAAPAGRELLHSSSRTRLASSGGLTWSDAPRMLWHVFPGALTVAIYRLVYYDRPALEWRAWPVARALLPLLAFFVAVEALRHTFGGLNALFLRACGPFLRREEVHGVNKSVYYVAGVTAAMALFPVDVAVAAVLLLAVCDPAASAAGRTLGRRSPRLLGSKSLAGSGAAAAAGAAVVCALYAPAAGLYAPHVQPLGAGALLALSLLGGSAAAAAELVGDRLVDDNLSLPLLAGAALWASRAAIVAPAAASYAP